MQTLAQIAASFARLDGVSENRLAQLDKALRNLTQRTYTPPDGQEGRAFLYGEESVAVIRLVYVASVFGLDRIMLDTVSGWLRTSGRRGIPRIREAVARAEAGEDFGFHVMMDAKGKVWCEADWKRDTERSQKADATRALTAAPEIGRFTLPAAALLRQLRAVKVE